MTTKPSFWQRIGIQDWFLTNEGTSSSGKPKQLKPDTVYRYIVDGFKKSLEELSFAQRVVFYHEFIICLNGDDYREFMDHKKGILGLIAHETVKNFYTILNREIKNGKQVEPASNKWVFRFVSHPDYRPGDIGFIGKLLPDSHQKEENLRVTFIPRQTGMAQTFDINNDILKDFIYYSDGYYEIPFQDDQLVPPPAPPEAAPVQTETTAGAKKTTAAQQSAVLARFETTIPDKAYAGKKLEFVMKYEQITISGDEEERNAPDIFRIPSEWVNTPHLKVRYDRQEDKFYLASFGEKTILNEVLMERSDINGPKWAELPLNSRIILNGIIGMNIFKS
ncbi:hypothetical protein [Pedobacter sp. JY14-1]|uniref:hypothetical protein n=1 Tax=Pedobacter sp. JY14-1 TaxID=3034151 RepID=UPI0023E2C065|nr:hypothetical protein [Pedobacter sp. JY14-1]